MISKQFIIFGLFILVVEYYTFVAVKTVLRNTNSGFHWWLFILYAALSLGALWSLWAFPHWARTSWPSVAMKYIVNIFIGVFIGKVLVVV